ncbi:5-formyltetrahydrofolate cyclo-ligase [Streptomyces sp. NPDC059455]|uniref:5-formyltetrahydrofolate cyclo-ligase n=1 Tax=Streptomyces sp. NPDC059455 TaxID=3346837 RepID=UPI0036820464
MNRTQVQRAKQTVRERVWTLLEPTHGDVTGRIPSFIGADPAAARLAEHLAWQTASVIKAVPDKAQLPVRARALQQGKRIYMASPKLATKNPFYLLDPERLSIPPVEAAERRTAAIVAQPVDVNEMPLIDMIVCGSVAVNSQGVRLGKGAGYSDIEVALLQEAGLIGPHTLIATTVHPLQVVEEVLPESEHDFRVDLIVTPDQTIECPPHPRPPGIFWEHLAPESIAAIPALAKRQPNDR